MSIGDAIWSRRVLNFQHLSSDDANSTRLPNHAAPRSLDLPEISIVVAEIDQKRNTSAVVRRKLFWTCALLSVTSPKCVNR